MKKYLLSLLLLPLFSQAQINTGLHCGYDFTTYLVVEAKSEDTKEMISGLKLSIVNQELNEVINTANMYSYVKGSMPLTFSENYKIDDRRWYFPYAEQSYLLSLANTFTAENFKLKIEDIDGKDNGGYFETLYLDLYNYNLYVLCSSENAKATQFGRKIKNEPIQVYLKKKK